MACKIESKDVEQLPPYESDLNNTYLSNLQDWINNNKDNLKNCTYNDAIKYFVKSYTIDKVSDNDLEDKLKCVCKEEEPILCTDASSNIINSCAQSTPPKCWIGESPWNASCIDSLNKWINQARVNGVDEDEIGDYLSRIDTSLLYDKICPSNNCDSNKVTTTLLNSYPFRRAVDFDGPVYLRFNIEPVKPNQTIQDCSPDPVTIDCKNYACAMGSGLYAKTTNQDGCHVASDQTCPTIGNITGRAVAFDNYQHDGVKVPLICEYAPDFIQKEKDIQDLFNTEHFQSIENLQREFSNSIWTKILGNYCLYNIYDQPCDAYTLPDKKTCTPLQGNNKECRLWYDTLMGVKNSVGTVNKPEFYSLFDDISKKFCRQENTFYDSNSPDGPLGIWKSELCSCYNAAIDKNDKFYDYNKRFGNEYNNLYQNFSEIDWFKNNDTACWLKPCKPLVSYDNRGVGVLQNPKYFNVFSSICKEDDPTCCDTLPDCSTILINDGTIDAKVIADISCSGNKGPKQTRYTCTDNNLCTNMKINTKDSNYTMTYPTLPDCTAKCQSSPSPSPPPPSSSSSTSMIIIWVLVFIISLGIIIILFLKYKHSNKSTRIGNI